MSLPRDYRPPPVSPDEPIEPWPLRPRMVLLVGLTCWIISYGLSETTISDAGRQALFIPAGISVGLLLRLPGRLWVWVLAVMATVDLVGGVLLTTLDSALIWAPANVIQTLVVAAALRWLRVDMTRTRDPFLIAVVAAIVVTLVAIPGSLALARAQQIDPTQFWADWWGSDVVAILLVVPVILLVGRATLPRGRLAVEAGGWFALSAAVVTALFLDDGLWVPVWIWLVIGAPLMVLYGVRFGLLAMTGALLILDWIAISLTANGLGPFQDLALSENGTPLRTLQLVSIVLAVTVQSVCLLVHRNLRHGRTLAVQQALLDAVIEGSPVATALLDADQPHRIVRANRAFRDLLPAAQSDVRQCFVGSEGDALVRLIASVQTGDDAVSGEFTTTDSDGRPLLLRMRVAAVVADEFDRYGTLRSGANVTRVLHAEDITDVRSREHRLRHYATTDELTGLANRRQLLHVLHASLSRISRDHQLAVAYLDLDGFKQINDRHGHATGDGVLQDVADCLRDSVRPTDLVARAGGDEFVIVSLNLPNSDIAVTQAQRVLARLADIPTSPEPLRASIGIAVTDDPHRPAEDLLRVADRRMYQAKASGGGIVAI